MIEYGMIVKLENGKEFVGYINSEFCKNTFETMVFDDLKENKFIMMSETKENTLILNTKNIESITITEVL